MRPAFDMDALSLRHRVAADRRAGAASSRLLREVFGADVEPWSEDGPWTGFAFFEPNGRCVAGLEAGLLPLILDGEKQTAGAIRSVAVAAEWRGHGLFRRLMTVALEWCGTQTQLIMLFTEDPKLYEPFGFRSVPQHAFVGAATTSGERSFSRKMILTNEDDRQLVRTLAAHRAPVSARCSLCVDTPLLMTNLAKDDALTLLYDKEGDMIVVIERDGDEVIFVDVIASQITSLATLMHLVAPPPSRIRCLFPTDKLSWHGTPIREETGLMIRGPLPRAMAEPFMFPPTSEF